MRHLYNYSVRTLPCNSPAFSDFWVGALNFTSSFSSLQWTYNSVQSNGTRRQRFRLNSSDHFCSEAVGHTISHYQCMRWSRPFSSSLTAVLGPADRTFIEITRNKRESYWCQQATIINIIAFVLASTCRLVPVSCHLPSLPAFVSCLCPTGMARDHGSAA